MLLAAVGMRREARLVERPGVRAAIGGGRADLLEQRLRQALEGARAVISIGRSMHMKVIAEGVETVSQLAWLRAEGCEEAQGFYFSRPLPTLGMTTLLKQWANFLHNPRGKLQARHLWHPS